MLAGNPLIPGGTGAEPPNFRTICPVHCTDTYLNGDEWNWEHIPDTHTSPGPDFLCNKRDKLIGHSHQVT